MQANLYIERKRLWCEENSRDQKNRGNEISAAWWDGRAKSFQEIGDAIRSGVVTPDGITPLEFDARKHGWNK